MQYDFDKLMHRIKNLQEFTVTIPVPLDFEFKGKIPFDMIIADNEATVIVYALDVEEAMTKVSLYFYGPR